MNVFSLDVIFSELTLFCYRFITFFSLTVFFLSLFCYTLLVLVSLSFFSVNFLISYN